MDYIWTSYSDLGTSQTYLCVASIARYFVACETRWSTGCQQPMHLTWKKNIHSPLNLRVQDPPYMLSSMTTGKAVDAHDHEMLQPACVI
jgi:hypothetical protein